MHSIKRAPTVRRKIVYIFDFPFPPADSFIIKKKNEKSAIYLGLNQYYFAVILFHKFKYFL